MRVSYAGLGGWGEKFATYLIRRRGLGFWSRIGLPPSQRGGFRQWTLREALTLRRLGSGTMLIGIEL
jgi:hypothetical protein